MQNLRRLLKLHLLLSSIWFSVSQNYCRWASPQDWLQEVGWKEIDMNDKKNLVGSTSQTSQ